MRKILFTIILAVITMLPIDGVAFAGTWEHNTSGWWFQNDNGTYPTNTWKMIDGEWYYFNDASFMMTGWIQSDGKWYYCNLNGSLATDCWVGEKYYVGFNGAMYVNATTPDGENVDGNGCLVSVSENSDSQKQLSKAQIVGRYAYNIDYSIDEASWDLILESDNTFTLYSEYGCDINTGTFLWNRSMLYYGTYIYDENKCEVTFYEKENQGFSAPSPAIVEVGSIRFDGLFLTKQC